MYPKVLGKGVTWWDCAVHALLWIFLEKQNEKHEQG